MITHRTACAPRSFFNKEGKDKSEVKKYYEQGAELGSGNFATVYKCKRQGPRSFTKPDNSSAPIPEDVAVKVIDKTKVEDMNDITREIAIMQMVSHPNVIQLYEIFDEAKKMNLVIEVRARAGRVWPRAGVRLVGDHS